jgi:hypothetical protein
MLDHAIPFHRRRSVLLLATAVLATFVSFRFEGQALAKMREQSRSS